MPKMPKESVSELKYFRLEETQLKWNSGQRGFYPTFSPIHRVNHVREAFLFIVLKIKFSTNRNPLTVSFDVGFSVLGDKRGRVSKHRTPTRKGLTLV